MCNYIDDTRTARLSLTPESKWYTSVVDLDFKECKRDLNYPENSNFNICFLNGDECDPSTIVESGELAFPSVFIDFLDGELKVTNIQSCSGFVVLNFVQFQEPYSNWCWWSEVIVREDGDVKNQVNVEP
eukprot:UN10461